MLKLLLAVVAPLALLAALELLARTHLGDRFVSGFGSGGPRVMVGAFDPELGWVNRPGASTHIVALKLSYKVRINSKGLRDREHPYELPPGIVRIALFGDSVAWGWGVDDGKGPGDLLEELLAPAAEVINLAVPGYSTDQELWTLEREGRRYRPDLVLLCFVMNDIDGNTSLKHSMKKPRYERAPDGTWSVAGRPVPEPGPHAEHQLDLPWLVHLHSRSALLQFLRPFVLAVDPGNAPAMDPEQQHKFAERHLERCVQRFDELASRDSVHVMLLRRLKGLCDEIGAPLVVLVVPHHHDHYLYNPAVSIPPELATAQAQGPEPFRTRLTQVMVELGLEIGFTVIEVDQAMLEAARRGELLMVPDGHLNERGNAIVAGVAAAALRPMVDRLLH